jgi:hypothetical protein
MSYSPEVLIYSQNFKKYLDNNDDVRNYFLKNVHEEEFFRKLLEVSEENFKKDGNPELTIQQFEILRIKKEINKQVNENNDNIFTYQTENIKIYIK